MLQTTNNKQQTTNNKERNKENEKQNNQDDSLQYGIAHRKSNSCTCNEREDQ